MIHLFYISCQLCLIDVLIKTCTGYWQNLDVHIESGVGGMDIKDCACDAAGTVEVFW